MLFRINLSTKFLKYLPTCVLLVNIIFCACNGQARPLTISALETGNFIELVDPMLESKYNNQEMQRMIACAAASIRHSARKRPKMSQVPKEPHFHK
jgi:hypothetical protein